MSPNDVRLRFEGFVTIQDDHVQQPVETRPEKL